MPSPPDGATVRSRIFAVLDLLGAALVFALFASEAARHVVHPDDLRSAHTAATAALRGLDPYDPAVLVRVAGGPVPPFVHSPVALLAFTPLARLPFQELATGWMAFQLLLLAALAVGWARSLDAGPRWTAVALLVAFGSNGAARGALVTGNVALLECALVWAALAGWAAGRRVAFALLIAAAACFQLASAAFLLLLLVPTARRKGSIRAFLLAAGLVAAVVFAPLAFAPFSGWARFWSPVASSAGPGTVNPSGPGLARALVDVLPVPAAWAESVATAVWAAGAALLLLLGRPLFAAARARRDARRWVVVAVFTYILLLPRPMAYGWIVLGVAPLALAPRPFRGAVGRLVLALLLAAPGLWRLTGNESASPLVVHAPYLLAACVWLLAARDAGSGERAPARSRIPADHAAFVAA